MTCDGASFNEDGSSQGTRCIPLNALEMKYSNLIVNMRLLVTQVRLQSSVSLGIESSLGACGTGCNAIQRWLGCIFIFIYFLTMIEQLGVGSVRIPL